MSESGSLQAMQRFLRAELCACSDEAGLEAQLILKKVTGLERPVLLSHPERLLTDSEKEEALALLEARKRGEPLPYLLGRWEFYGSSFRVNSSVLIPRPETELMVEAALGWLRKHPACHRFWDIGTGSGCIGISLLLARADLCCVAADISLTALRTARKNALDHGCSERFDPVCGDLSTALSGPVELVCANLPYIPSAGCDGLEAARYEPLNALDGGADGFDFYRVLFGELREKTADDFLILCEIEYSQRNLALRTAREYFPEAETLVEPDLAGLPRLLSIFSR